MTINAYVVVNMTLFTKENNVQNILRQDKCYGARYLLKEFHLGNGQVYHSIGQLQ